MNQFLIKKEFPIFKHQLNLVYLDSAATALKPASVIEAEKKYLEEYTANIARGLYPNAEKATVEFESVREKAARFLDARTEEIVFTSGTTDAINLAARLIEHAIGKEHNIVTTEIEHHSNFLPWKELAQRRGAEFRVTPLLPDGKIDQKKLDALIDKNTHVFAFSAVSNVTGTIQDVNGIVRKIREKSPDVFILVDAAQAIGHEVISVRDWGADFVAFSGHKFFGPTGIGVLYGRKEILETLPPVSFGGGMVLDACAPDAAYKEVPYRFEAGTPNIGGAIGLGAAFDFVEKIGPKNIRDHEKALSEYARTKLLENFGEKIQVLGPAHPEERGGVLAFTLAGLHPHDIAQVLGEKNICIRAGEHCAAPLHRSLGLSATARLSFSIYNDTGDIDTLIEGLKEAEELLKSLRS